MAAYADYLFYVGTFGGSAITSEEFSSLITRVSALIDHETVGRAAAYMELTTPTDEEELIIEKIKLATCAVMEELLSIQNSGGNVISESVGSHSVTYAKSEQLSSSKRLSDSAKPFLASTGLMYRGFYEDEYSSNFILS